MSQEKSYRYSVIETAGVIRKNYPTINGREIEAQALNFAIAPTVESFNILLDLMVKYQSTIHVDLRRRLMWTATLAREQYALRKDKPKKTAAIDSSTPYL